MKANQSVEYWDEKSAKNLVGLMAVGKVELLVGD